MVAAVFAAFERSFSELSTGLDQIDICVWSDGVGPFDVERDLEEPPVRPSAGNGLVWPTMLYLVKLGGSGRPNCWSKTCKRAGIEVGIGRVHEIRVVADIDDRDRLAGAIADDAVGKSDVVNAIGPGDLRRHVTCRSFENRRVAFPSNRLSA